MLPKTRNGRIAWVLVVGYLAGIWAASSISVVPFRLDAFPWKDKGAHALLFAGLAALACRAFHGSLPEWPIPGRALAAWALTVVWGIIDEVHQRFTPGRSSDVVDIVADSIGASVSACLYVLLIAWHVRRSA